MNINKVTLRFRDPGTELAFAKEYVGKFIINIRIALMLAAILYAMFGILDALMMSEQSASLMLVRYGMVLPVILVIYLITFTPFFDRFNQLILSFGALITSFGPLYITAMGEIAGTYSYYAGLILVTIYIYLFLRIRFLYATVVCFTVVVLYIIVSLTVVKGPGDVLVNNVFFLVSANIISGVSAYAFEFFYRRSYYLLNLLNVEKQKVEQANAELEQRVTERTRQLENANRYLQMAKSKAEESDRLKSAFLANMSHEIRTPMNGILGFTELMRRRELDAVKRNEYLEIIHRKGLHLLNILNDIIDVSKIEANQLQFFAERNSINQLLDDLRQTMLASHPKKFLEIELKLSKGLADDKAWCFFDNTRLHQVLTNLLSNAAKFTEKGHIHFGYHLNKEDTLLFFVRDTGKGIPFEKTEAIFERFLQLDHSPTKRFEGTGLGLAICKGLVNSMGGEIWVESSECTGSDFYFTLPYTTKSQNE